MSSTFFITTAIDYPNGDPHLGHAYEKIISDAYARWYRLTDRSVFFLTGTDENGQKLSKSAEKHGQSTQEFVDHNVSKFKELCRNLNISNDDFIRTTEERHHRVVHQIWSKLEQNGDIYLDRYSGEYCLACEAFYPESQQGKDKTCPEHGTPLTPMAEDGYFFRLSRYQDWIIQHITDHPQFIFPSHIRTEILSRLKLEKLQDLSISRPNQGWGIPIQNDPQHVIYTWFDALINYYAADTSRWPADVHVIGKDISWFHTVIWPSMLKSAGIELPRQVYVHGMVLGSDGKRMSKSLGNGVDPQECLKLYPLDSFRYYILKAIPSGQDGAFITDDLIRLHNGELANEYGNLLMRVIKLSLSSLGSELSGQDLLTSSEAPSQTTSPSSLTPDLRLSLWKEVSRCMDSREHHLALAHIWSGVRELNAFINREEPWKKKSDPAALKKIMFTALVNMQMISLLLIPFIPDSAKRALHMLGCSSTKAMLSPQDFAHLDASHIEFSLVSQDALFPKIEVKP